MRLVLALSVLGFSGSLFAANYLDLSLHTSKCLQQLALEVAEQTCGAKYIQDSIYSPDLYKIESGFDAQLETTVGEGLIAKAKDDDYISVAGNAGLYVIYNPGSTKSTPSLTAQSFYETLQVKFEGPGYAGAICSLPLTKSYTLTMYPDALPGKTFVKFPELAYQKKYTTKSFNPMGEEVYTLAQIQRVEVRNQSADIVNLFNMNSSKMTNLKVDLGKYTACLAEAVR